MAIPKLTPEVIVADLSRVMHAHPPPDHTNKPSHAYYLAHGGVHQSSTIADVCGGWRRVIQSWQTGKRLGRARHEAVMRSCLICDQPFLSEGVGHRVCPQCKEQDGYKEGYGAVFHLRFTTHGIGGTW